MARSDTHTLLDETVRRERGWLISSLVSKFGPSKVDLAEDVAQDAIVKALATWPYKGIPDNPRAWLRRVASNAAIDRVRRSSREFGVDEEWDLATSDSDIITPSLSDPELDLMVLCCDPALELREQVFLALKTVCGFTASETAALFFMSEDALSQCLSRGKRKLKAQSGEIARFPTRFALNDRLPNLMKVIYLMFAWGYMPRRGDDVFLRDVCQEAVRMSAGLLSHAHRDEADHHALHALLLFQAARLPARRGERGELLTLEHQDRTKWDVDLIAKAFDHLSSAQNSSELSRYHLEAGIASVHAEASTWDKTQWPVISRLYQLLHTQAPSLAVRVNWAVSLMMAGDVNMAQQGLSDAASLPGADKFSGYHLARAKLSQLKGDREAAVMALNAAKACPVSGPVRDHIEREISLSG